MHETFHYKGNFDFYYYETNQKKLAKDFLKYVFPEEVIKKARGKKYESIEQTVLIERTKVLSRIFQECLPEQCSNKINRIASQDIDLAVSLYLIAKHRLANASLNTRYFNVKDELGRLVMTSII